MTAPGRLSAKATSADGQIVFKNAYSAAPTSITFGGTKVLTGAELAAGQFAFQLKDAQGNVVATGHQRGLTAPWSLSPSALTRRVSITSLSPRSMTPRTT